MQVSACESHKFAVHKNHLSKRCRFAYDSALFLRVRMHRNVFEEVSAAYKQHFDALYRHCKYRLYSEEDAQELVQDAFMNVCQYLTRGRDIENIKVFLYKVTNNLIVDQARRRKSQQKNEVSLDALQESGFDLEIADDTRKVQRRMEARKILLAGKKLKREDYDLLVMRYIDGLKPADIARVLGVSPNNVSVRLHRVLRQISVSLSQDARKYTADV